jgi:2-polyprenyl-3-methyl-5-hydroxy-6-metoxy-1,4-benzoquinol methylase
VTAPLYQTDARNRAKERAILPMLPTLFHGLRVLDIGCNRGHWCALAVSRGASEVLGIDREPVAVWGAKPDGWTYQRNTITDFDGTLWPRPFDVVFCLAVYHHLFAVARSHDVVWAWLARHLSPSGILIWDAPTSTADGVARQRARSVPDVPYTREAIRTAAEKYVRVTAESPAYYRPHREVWRCELP